MSDGEYSRKRDELERLLNDPNVPMEPGLIWSLLDELRRETEAKASSASPSTTMAPRMM